MSHSFCLPSLKLSALLIQDFKAGHKTSRKVQVRQPRKGPTSVGPQCSSAARQIAALLRAESLIESQRSDSAELPGRTSSKTCQPPKPHNSLPNKGKYIWRSSSTPTAILDMICRSENAPSINRGFLWTRSPQVQTEVQTYVFCSQDFAYFRGEGDIPYRVAVL